MTIGFWIAQILSGLASAATLFMVSAGLTLVFGVTRIVNFAHGAFYMLGAFLTYSLIDRWMGGQGWMFWVCVTLGAAGVAVFGSVVEIVLLRRVYRSPEMFQMLIMFAVALIVGDVLLLVYGPDELLAPRIPGLTGGTPILGQRFPTYDLVMIGLAVATFAVLWFLLQRTRFGILVRAATFDREMLGALGVNQAWLFTTVFALGSFLAGFGGALQVARESANLGMGANIIAEVFVVVVIGGMGSLPGALLASVLIGELNAFGVAFFPQLTLVLTFLVMAVILILRPWGLLGRKEGQERTHELSNQAPLRPLGRRGVQALVGALALSALLPLALDSYGLTVMTDILIAVIFAASLYLILVPGGMTSFGHACYFGVGAYAVALLVHDFGWPLLPSLAASVVAGILLAIVFGFVCVRLGGIYFAMLTLAFAQIVWSVVFQWYGVTGGDNGMIGIWPAPHLTANKTLTCYCVLGITVLAVASLAGLLRTPFGATLRLTRDSPVRAATIGISVFRHRWLAFVVAGAFAGLAGGLATLNKGSVFPDAVNLNHSIDALVMILLGGVEGIVGPLTGAAVFVGAQTATVQHTDYWRLILGLLIIAIVLLFPQGIVGAIRKLAARGVST
jgi:branched-chain amino acid transport system permease protein